MMISLTDIIGNPCPEMLDLNDPNNQIQRNDRMYSFISDSGFYFVPAHLSAKGKRPMVRHWKQDCKRFIDDAVPFIEWDLDLQPLGYMIDCEKSGLVVIDCDLDKTTHESTGDANFLSVYGDELKALEERGTCYIVRSPSGGHHYYFKSDRAFKSCAGELLPHVDVRSRGGLIVCPFSRNPDVGIYEPLATAHNLSPIPENIPALPESLEKALEALDHPNADAVDIGGLFDDRYTSLSQCVKQGSDLPLYRAISKIRSAAPGERNQTLSRQAWHAFKVGYTHGRNIEDLEMELVRAGKSAGLPENEVILTVRSAKRAAIS